MTFYELAIEEYNKLENYFSDKDDCNVIQLLRDNTFEDLIKRKENSKCKNFIFSVLGENIKDSIDSNRAKHILMTWLLGIRIGEELGISDFANFSRLDNSRLWLQTALIHDIGYYNKDNKKDSQAKKEAKRLEEYTGKYDLLEDKYTNTLLLCLNGLMLNSEFSNLFTYSSELIRNYYEYSIDFNKDNEDSNEIADHGIVGGCKAFSDYCKKITKANEWNDKEIIMKKISCYTAASHNIFKSPNTDIDDIYIDHELTGILSCDNPSVTRENKLLLLLSIVDTIECVKKYTKNSNKSNSKFIQASTILKKINIEFDSNSVILDFNNLYDYIRMNRTDSEKEFIRTLNDHISKIKGMSDWTDIKTLEENEFRIRLFFEQHNI